MVKGPGVITGRYGSIGEVFFMREDFWPLNTTLWVKDFHGNDKRFIAYLLSSIDFRKFSGKTGVPGVNRNELHKIEVPCPPQHQQLIIAALISKWDEAIAGTERLLEARKKRNRILAYHLLTGRSRIRKHASSRKEVRLKDVTKELKSRNNDHQLGSETVMAVSKFHGLIPMREHVMASSLERYKAVPPKAFAYNHPMRINIGSLAMSHHASDVLVSPDYVVFKCLEDRCDPDLLDHYRRTHAWEQYVNAVGNGSVRVRIYYSELARMKLRLPPIEEQKAISEVLNDADREIELTKRKLAALQKQKRGLMQKLLTGEWRLKKDKDTNR
jgi:type I restriction enzyme S subunit